MHNWNCPDCNAAAWNGREQQEKLDEAYAHGRQAGIEEENERCIASVLRHAANSKIFNEVKQVEDWLRHVADDLRSTCPVKLESEQTEENKPCSENS